MLLYFHFDNLVFEYSLPAVNDRRIGLNLDEKLGIELGLIDFEIWDNEWRILSNEHVEFHYNQAYVTEHIIKNGDTIDGFILNKSVSFAITIPAIEQDYSYYKKYSLEGISFLKIGSDISSDIVINNEYTSKQHAVLQKRDSGFSIVDLSKNGTYVSNQRINGEFVLDIMDVIYITGVKIVYMGDFLAINRAEVSTIKLPPFILKTKEQLIAREQEPLIRSPRFLEPLEVEAMEIESPPAPQNTKRPPAIFTFGPALTMPIPILISMLINLNQSGQGGNFLLSTLSSVVLSALVATSWAVANMIYSKNTAKKEELNRQNAYKAYIQENEMDIQKKHQKNTSIIGGQHLSVPESLALLSHNTSVLWNRNVNQTDFLDVRLGIGLVKFQSDILIPKQRFSLVNDPLQSEPAALLEKYEFIPNAVSLINLRENKIIGVLGDKINVRKIAQIIALQTATLHSYVDVKMAFILTSGEEQHYEWAKPMPHVRWQENKVRLICSTDTERQNVFFYLNSIFRARLESQNEYGGNKNVMLPHIIIFCTSPELIVGENINKYLSDDNSYGVTFVLLYGLLDKLPNECNNIIQWDNDYKRFYQLDSSLDKSANVEFDHITNRNIMQLSRKISGYYIRELATGEIPSSISFLEMHNTTSIENWELLKRWKENRAYESLRALVGIGSGGKPIYLDIHEKQHGPHGLMAGTTGSGKSETIQTYILSLVMNFHPHEVALILIDYKGGGMANAFQELPHLAGTITNLDSNQVLRALVSIKAEIKRRQTLFNQYNVNHIDNYSRYFREGVATEPLPHLIIISDEFAELKKEQPEFIKELVSTARVGRSLGVHLILATQKPSGVVDDEIWSNSRFKLCLRVQDKQDSNEMLHRPDAAYLTHIGRAYMQIGNDEIFELFQSGYSGAYYESDSTASPEDNEITMIGLDGSPLMIHKKDKVGVGENRPTQLSACVEFIRKTSDENGVENVRPLWMPELKEGITLKEIYSDFPVPQEEGITALIGLIDNPYTQTQHGAIIPLSKISHLLIAGIPGSGKSTMLQTMLYSLVTRYTPTQVIFYCLDFSSTLTRVFADLPHCGGVVGADDKERTTRLFQLMQSFIKERGQLFDKAMVGSFDEYNLVAEQAIPMILLCLDNLYAFNEAYPNLADEQLLSISNMGAKYGIHMIVTVNHMNDVKYKLRQNFDLTLPLMLAERGDYHDALGFMPPFLPGVAKGRGLWGDDALEYQTALAVVGENEKIRAETMMHEFSKLTYDGYSAPKIKFIPKNKTYSEFLETIENKEAIYLGYATEDISFVKAPLATTYCYAISGSSHRAVENTMNNVIEAANHLGGKKHLLALKYEPNDKYIFDGIGREDADVFEMLKTLKEEFSKRSAIRKQSIEQGEEPFNNIQTQQGLYFVFIDSMNDFLNIIYDVHDEDFYPLVELFFKQGKNLGVYFIAGFEPAVYSTNMYKEAYKLFVEYGTGIHLGGKLDQQKLIDMPFLNSATMKAQDISEGIIMVEDQIMTVFVPKNTIDL